MSVFLSVLKGVGASLLKALITKKVALKLSVLMLEKAISWDATGPALDKALVIVKEEVEKIK